MLYTPEKPDWPRLLQPLAEASTALGRLACALDETPLHQAWVWRETARAAVKISQIAGHRAQAERLMLSLSGVPLDPAEEPGLAAARRVFLNAAPLFRLSRQADSNTTDLTLTEPLWGGYVPTDGQATGLGGEKEDDRKKEEAARLLALVQDLTADVGRGTRPPLLNLLLGLRRHPTARRLPSDLARLALPLAFVETGLISKSAPGLLGGRLPLGLTRSAGAAESITLWLIRALQALAREAAGSEKRLAKLASQLQAWRARLAAAGLRRHALAPKALDLLSATPALSSPLAARHLGCSPQGASLILRRLTDLGILVEATARSRWKIYLAADLAVSTQTAVEATHPLASNELVPAFDREGIEAALNNLLRDLERLQKRTRAALAEEGRRPELRTTLAG